MRTMARNLISPISVEECWLIKSPFRKCYRSRVGNHGKSNIYKHYTRLDLLATIFDIPSSKEGIDGSMVNTVYYKEDDLDNIRKYCLRDVEVTARIYLAYQGLPGDLSFEIINLDSPAV